MSYYPHGSVPGQGYVQPGVQANPVGYVSPVANPFYNIVANHGMSKMISGMTGSSSSFSSDPDVTVVTYDSYMKEKDYSKTTLGISESDLKTFGKPLGIKFKDCDLIVPLPSKGSVCRAIDNQIEDVVGGATISDTKRKEIMQKINDNLAKNFFKKCKYGGDFSTTDCQGLPPARSNTGHLVSGKIHGVSGSIRNAIN